VGDDALSKHRNGATGELKAAAYFSEQGYEIYSPWYGAGSIDFIAVKQQEIIRVQVKSAYWTRRPSGCEYLQVTIRKGAGGNQSYTKEDCDVIVVVHENKLWQFPVEAVIGKMTINLERKQYVRQRTSNAFDPSSYQIQ
jgi:hypothetical protein